MTNESIRQRWDPDSYARNARYVSDLGMPVVELLAPQSGERILDLGCGDGALTEKLVAIGCIVIGVDSSTEQVAGARTRGIDARVIDAAALPFEREFDAVFSNATLHWIRNAEAVVASVYRALKPGGRFVGEFGGSGNIIKIRTALTESLRRRGIDAAALDPWFFPTAEHYRGLLESRGFALKSIALFPRPTPLPTGMSGWLETFAQSFLLGLDPGARQQVIQEVCAAVSPSLHDSDGGWFADYVRLRFSAYRPLLP